MRKNDQHFPCIKIRNLENKVLAAAGWKLEALFSAEILKSESSFFVNKKDNQALTPLESSVGLVQNLIAWDKNTFAEMHWVSWPNLKSPAKGRIDITLTLNHISDTEAAAKEEVLTRFLPFQGLLHSHLPEAVWEPIFDLEVLQERIEAFVPRSCVAILRRSQPVSLILPLQLAAGSVGFIMKSPDAGSRKSSGAFIEHTFPWIPSIDSLHRLIKFLLWYPEPVHLQVRLRSYPTPEIEKEFLLQTIKQCNEILENPLKTGETILGNQTTAIRDFLLKRMAELSQGMVEIAPYVSSHGLLDELLLKNIAISFLGLDTNNEGDGIFQGGASLLQVVPEKMEDPFWAPEARAYSCAEAASFFRLPWPSQSELPGIPVKRWRSSFANLPELKNEEGTAVILGRNIHRGVSQMVQVQEQDRLRHMYIIGQTGTGKSTFLENLIIQDINAGRGVCLIDPHGELFESILAQYPLKRKDDLIIIDLTDQEFPFSLNVLKYKTPDERDRIIDDLYVWIDRAHDLRATGGPIFEKYMRGGLRTLMGDGNYGFTPTLLEFPMFFTDRKFRDFLRQRIEDDEIKLFLSEIEKVHGDGAIENISVYITSKTSRFTQDSRLRRIFGQETLSFDFSAVMDEGKVMLINLGKGIFGEMVSSLVASQIVGGFKAAAMKRAKVSPEERKSFFLYVDEFQNIAHEDFATLLAEARKYHLGLIFAHQYTMQLQRDWVGRKDTLLSSVLGNVGMILAFRLGVEDAKKLEEVFAPSFSARDLMELPNWEAYMKIHMGRENILPFNIQTIKPQGFLDQEKIKNLIEWSRHCYCRPAAEVDKEIKARWKWIRERVEDR